MEDKGGKKKKDGFMTLTEKHVRLVLTLMEVTTEGQRIE